MAARRALPRTVVVLGMVSLLNDAASEMVTPILPLFLTATLGAGPAIVGLVEGIAQATASVLRLVAGRLTDGGWKPRPLIIAGYGISNLVRPLIGLAPGWGTVLGLRFLDRVGKGVRGTPRDALLAGAVDQTLRGRAFGFHRAMDHTGAMLGPLLAFALLAFGLELRHVFLVSAVPGLLLMLLLFRGVPHGPPAERRVAPRLSWAGLDGRVRALLIASSTLAVAAVPDAFLVLWAQSEGIPLVAIPLVWAAAHALRALSAGAGGALSDRVGRVPVVLAGWALRIALLTGIALSGASGIGIWALFLAYAAATALSEPAEIALLGDRTPTGLRGTVLGLQHMLVGLLALPGALGFGVLWQTIGMSEAFLAAAAITSIAAAVMLTLVRSAAGVPQS